MFKTLLYILTMTLFLASCTAPVAEEDKRHNDDTTLQAPNRSSQAEEDTDLLLARKWQSENGMLLLDLNLNGNFVGEMDGQPVEGQWQLSDDRKTLTLNENNGLEGKGQVLNVSYAVVSNTPESMVLQDEAGKTWTLAALE